MAHLHVIAVKYVPEREAIVVTVRMPHIEEQWVEDRTTRERQLVFHPDLPHDIEIPEHALEERRMLYGFRTQDESLEAILKEHVQRTHKMPPVGSDVLGGKRTDISLDVQKQHHVDAQRYAQRGTDVWKRYIESQSHRG